MLLMLALPQDLVSGSMVYTVFVVSVCLLAVSVIVVRAQAQELTGRELCYKLALFSWWFLVISEQLFVRRVLSQNAYEGNFSAAAYGEFMIWMVLFGIALALIYR